MQDENLSFDAGGRFDPRPPCSGEIAIELGIGGKRALICAASRGLGKGCAMALAAEGVAITITGRDVQALDATADLIRERTGAAVTTAPGDITTEAGREAALADCPAPDILVNNAGGPP